MEGSALVDVERLCSHHDASRFDCGDDDVNRQLEYFQNRFDLGDRVLGFVVCDDDLAILAYVILLDDVFAEEGSARTLRCFTVPAMGIDNEHRHRAFFHALINRAIEAMAVRQVAARATGSSYRGIVCMPGENEALRRWLISWGGFKPFPTGHPDDAEVDDAVEDDGGLVWYEFEDGDTEIRRDKPENQDLE